MATTIPASECAENGAGSVLLSAGQADAATIEAKKNDGQGFIIVLCTTPDSITAQSLAKALLGGKLAACVTLLPGATSLYVWEGKLEQQDEVQMLIKSHVRHQQELMALITAHHPYQTPELLILPVQGGSPDYLSWLNASLS